MSAAEARRWGLLSTARINSKIVRAAAASSALDIVAVASRDPVRAREHASAHGIERAHGDYESLLADDRIDAIYVSLPNHLHVEWSKRALRAGKHVLCEKPLSRRADDVVELFEVAAASGRLVSEAFMWRHHPQTRRLAQLLADGAVGRIRRIRAVFTFPLAPSPARLGRRLFRRPPEAADIRLVREYDGGSLMDAGCYCVSAARFVAGEPERVEARQTLGSTGIDERFEAVLHFPGGAVAEIACAFTAPAVDELEIVGELGSLFLDDPFLCAAPLIELRRDGAVERISIEHADPYKLELENVAAAAAGQAELLLGRRDAVAQARAIEALYLAAERSEPVKL